MYGEEIQRKKTKKIQKITFFKSQPQNVSERDADVSITVNQSGDPPPTPLPTSIVTASSSKSAVVSFPINVLSIQESATGISLNIFNPSKEKKIRGISLHR